uniref:Uncharacterized protein n=1 Tax=Lepeophtheirus salmonis TaxID=72036 RepID=A0A0K2T2S5_LEPSM
MLHVFLERYITVVSTNQSFSIKDCITRIQSHLILGCISNEPFRISECNIRRCSPIALIVSYNFYFSIFKYSNTGVSCSQINSNSFFSNHYYFLISFFYVCMILISYSIVF